MTKNPAKDRVVSFKSSFPKNKPHQNAEDILTLISTAAEALVEFESQTLNKNIRDNFRPADLDVFGKNACKLNPTDNKIESVNVTKMFADPHRTEGK